MRKNRMLVLVCLVIMICFAGCVGPDGKIKGERAVIRYVNSICEEPYELTGSELIEEEPDNMEYRFQTTERELSFQANSYLSPIWIDASETSFYDKKISCNYVSVVHDLYEEEVKKCLSDNERYLSSDGWMYLLSFSDIENVVDTILKADKVYQQELEFNSEEFLREYPVRNVHIVWFPTAQEAAEHDNWVNIMDIDINGLNTKEELYDRLANKYAQLYVDGELEDNGIPKKYLGDKHISLLEKIELDGTEMFYDMEENPLSECGLSTDNYKYCWYNKEVDSYMMVMDIGFCTDNGSYPLINREYVNGLGGSYHISGKGDTYTSSWTIGSDTWEMKSKYSDNVIRNFDIKKNGKKLDISYIESEDDYNIGALFCVGVSVEDFCKLFDLSYTVDEEAGKISFYSKE